VLDTVAPAGPCVCLVDNDHLELNFATRLPKVPLKLSIGLSRLYDDLSTREANLFQL
jgi:hypothetical protein